MALELYINDQLAELKEGTAISISYNIADIFSIGMVQSNYTDSFDLPFTPNNVQVFEGLSISGDTSLLPYQKVSAKVKYDGYDMIENGWMTITETAFSYKVNIIDGIRDLFKDIENKTIGNDLNISSLVHKKNMENVLTSMETERDYRYVTASFDGRTQSFDSTINIDYLIPVVKVSYFWDKIFSTFGYTYSGSIFTNPDYTNLCITYPKAPELDPESIEEELIAESTKGNSFDNTPVELAYLKYHFPGSYNWTTTNSTKGTWVNNWSFKPGYSSTFRFSAKVVGYVERSIQTFPFTERINYLLEVLVDGVQVASFSSREIDTGEFIPFDIALKADEEVSFRIVTISPIPVDRLFSNLALNVYELSGETIDFAAAFADFSIKDFLKEIMWRYGLIPVYEQRTKHITFLTMSEKINTSNYLDWSQKYVQRTKESYLFGAYAQKNIFAYKYNDDADNYNNGQMLIKNLNLEVSKQLITSKTYSPERNLTILLMGDAKINSPIYPLWKKEIVEEIVGSSRVARVDYKGLNGRFYFMKIQEVNGPGKYISEILRSDVETTTKYFIPNNSDVNFIDLVPKYYAPYERMLNNFRMHDIELNLELTDILNIDFTKVYFFEQEASFYMLNKLTWQSDKEIHKAEFIKIYQ